MLSAIWSPKVTTDDISVYIAGRAVINAAENGSSFPLKKRDQMLDYILTLMGLDENEDLSDSTLELWDTQVSNLFGVIVSGVSRDIVFLIPENHGFFIIWGTFFFYSKIRKIRENCFLQYILNIYPSYTPYI